MLEIKSMTKFYGGRRVLNDINLRLEKNKIYGLLGRNGVGKTTLLNILSNQIRSTSGEVLLNGENIFENSKAIENIAIVKESGFGVGDIKVKKIFQSAKILYKNWDERYKDFLVKEFKLDENGKYNKLSRGSKTIVGLITGLASRATLTLFDEPSLGLDAAYRYKFYNLLLRDVEKYPRTVIISTHLIDEVSNLFEEIIILKDQEIHLKEEVSKLMEKAYFLNGRLDKMGSIIKGKNIIHREKFGATTILGIFDNLSKDEKIKLKESGVDISVIPLQRLFVLLTEIDDIKEVI